jgi:hypothetical protein
VCCVVENGEEQTTIPITDLSWFQASSRVRVGGEKGETNKKNRNMKEFLEICSLLIKAL